MYIADRKNQLKRKYGLTLEKVDKMYQEQKGCCAICGNHYDKLVVDHNHDTGKVRDLLCNICNLGLGKFKDNKNILLLAVKYLEKHEEKKQ